MTELSNAAQALLAALWMNPRFTLRYGMVENVPSPQARAALDEMVDAAILARHTEPGGAVVYSLAPAGRAMDRAKSMAFVKEHGSFALSVPKTEAKHD